VTVSQWREWNARLTKAKAKARKDRQDLAQQCARELRDFGQQPGTHLWLVRAGIVRRELRTADQQTLACLRDLVPTAVSAGGRTFARKEVIGSSWPGIAEMVRHSHPNHGAGHFPDPDTPRSQQRQVKASNREPSRFARSSLNLEALVDETGLPVFYTSGRNYDHGAGARITFPDQRWLRFPVRGTGQADAIMTAVDQAGDEIAWYRLTGRLRAFLAHAMEIAVRPGQPLTDELVLALAISAPWLSSYFDVPSQGGG
jgi:hypothetical protein